MPRAVLAETIATPPGFRGVGWGATVTFLFLQLSVWSVVDHRPPEASQKVPAMSGWCHLTSCHL